MALLATVACSDDRGYDVDDVAADLRTAIGESLTEEEASCVATELIDEFGDEDFESVFDAARNFTEGDGDGQVRTKVIEIWSECDAVDSLIDAAPPADDTTTTSAPVDGGENDEEATDGDS